MRKHILAAFAAAMVFALTAGVASTALARPSYGVCSSSGCHSANAAITITAVAGTVGPTTTQYTIAVANSSSPASVGWAVYNGSTPVQNAQSSGTTIALTNGVTYTIYGAGLSSGGSKMMATKTLTVPLPDVTAPATTSDAQASYVNTATIHLAAADNVGGSGVAHTYYVLDSDAQTEGTAVTTSVLATHTLQFWSVDAKGNTETTKSVQFNVHAPVPDVTAPVTTSDLKSLYYTSAVINLFATDELGGSGVAHTFYVLDGGTQAEGTSIATSVLGTHTVEFWSVDASSNAETPHKTGEFTVAVNPAPVLYKFSYKFNLKKRVYAKLKAVLKGSTTGKKYTVTISKKGLASWKNLPAGRYRLNTTGNARFKFKARTVKVGS